MDPTFGTLHQSSLPSATYILEALLMSSVLTRLLFDFRHTSFKRSSLAWKRSLVTSAALSESSDLCAAGMTSLACETFTEKSTRACDRWGDARRRNPGIDLAKDEEMASLSGRLSLLDNLAVENFCRK